MMGIKITMRDQNTNLKFKIPTAKSVVLTFYQNTNQMFIIPTDTIKIPTDPTIIPMDLIKIPTDLVKIPTDPIKIPTDPLTLYHHHVCQLPRVNRWTVDMPSGPQGSLSCS